MRTRDNWKEIILLQYYHANLNLFADFLFTFVSDYVEREEREFDPGQSKLRQWHVKKMAADSRLYRQIANVGVEVVAALESLLDVNMALAGLTQQESKGKLATELAVLAAELRGCCKDVNRRVSGLSDDLEYQLKCLDLARSMKETENVQRLTVLATIFLPLSLAARILSMQSRFKDLDYLLYDFVGVAILLEYLAGTLLVIIFVLSSLK
jgi:Mg2+ and Co2+ transporter CorA